MKSAWIGVLLAVVGWAGCRTEPVTWRVPMHDVILLHDSLSWSDLVPDTLWEEGEEGLRLSVKTTRSLFDTGVLLPTLDTAWTDVFTLPFNGGPIPVAPGTALWEEQESVPFNAPGVGLRRARLASGLLRLTVGSTVQGPLELVYRLEGAEFPTGNHGGVGDIVLWVDGDTSEVVLDLSGVVLDLDGEDNLELGRMATTWSVSVPAAAAEPVGVMGSDVLTLSVELVGVEVAQVEGQFDHQSLEVRDTLVLQDLEALQELEVGWTELDLDLTLRNTTGLDIRTALGGLERIDDASGIPAGMALEDDVLGDPVWLARAQVSGAGAMDGWQIAPTEGGFHFSSTQGNLAEFLGSIPQALAWQVGLELNPLGDVTGGYDRVDLTRLPEVDVQLEAPLAVSSARARWVDTLDVVPPEWLDYDGFLDLQVESALPVGATLRLELVELPESMALFGPVFGPFWWRFEDMVLEPGSGLSDAPSLTTARIDFMQPHFEALRLGARLRVEVDLATPENGAEFRADQGVILRGHLHGDAQISVE